MSCDEELRRLKIQWEIEVASQQDDSHRDLLSQSMMNSFHTLTIDKDEDIASGYLQIGKLIDRLHYMSVEEISNPDTCRKMLQEAQSLLSISLSSGRLPALSTSMGAFSSQDHEKWPGRSLVIRFLLILSRLSRLVEPILMAPPEARTSHPDNALSMKPKYHSLAISPIRPKIESWTDSETYSEDDSMLSPMTPRTPDDQDFERIDLPTPIFQHSEVPAVVSLHDDESSFSSSFKKGGVILQKIVSWFKSPTLNTQQLPNLNADNSKIIPGSPEKKAQPLTPPPSVSMPSREFIVCRICEEHILAQDLQTHSDVCMQTSRWESLLKSYDEYLEKVIKAISDSIATYLERSHVMDTRQKQEQEALSLLHMACSKILHISIDRYASEQVKCDDEFQRTMDSSRSWKDDVRFFRVQALLQRIYEVAIEKQTVCRNVIRQGLYKSGKVGPYLKLTVSNGWNSIPKTLIRIHDEK
eukprot:TRINITY_DN3375_c0_g1_i2.p1 TRINITY_DN3375_c0_g1~~TRINITY_DN3375_c0_g1_i2.p1  ORF type:complete len:470 (+),score=84.96 TRINITY_DN3375_c0_g1_i2:1235-2644(+)